MAISSLTIDWLLRLKSRGLFKSRTSILELGPQDMLVTNWKTSAEFYRYLGFKQHVSSDFSDTRATYYLDLNEPVDEWAKLEVVFDCGTLEHVFSIGQAMQTVHDLCADDGLMLHILPALGDINHGFWNVHPTVYYDIAHANGYEILDWHYVDDMERRITIRNEQNKPFDFDSLPCKIDYSDVHVRFHQKNPAFNAKALSLETGRAAYCYIAMRKIPSMQWRPFKFPIQSTYR
jgi:hypothetical protein